MPPLAPSLAFPPAVLALASLPLGPTPALDLAAGAPAAPLPAPLLPSAALLFTLVALLIVKEVLGAFPRGARTGRLVDVAAWPVLLAVLVMIGARLAPSP